MAREPELQELASAVADGQQVDWDGLMQDPEAADSTVIQNLSRISRLMEAHRHLIREHLPFETWGKLRLLEKIGEGGFGEVYRAWDESLGREVALKLFRQKQDGDSVRGTMSSQQAEDLMMEARRLARVRHENVVHVYGAEEHRHRAGFWMELVTGETLATLMHGQGIMDAEEAAHVGMKVCGGLAAIHKSGLLHRDIKAQNVMCDADGRIVLTDMGAGVDLRFTASGLPRSIAGTPLYMAPELILGRSGDHTADIYSMGVLLYHLVSGRFPYENQTFAALKEDHEQDRGVSLAERRPDLPAAFLEIVERATAHDPRNRFQSAAELEAALRPLAIDPGLVAPRPWSRGRIVLGALLAVLLLGAGLWSGRELLAPTASIDAQIAERGRIRRLTFSGDVSVPIWSPDGRTLAYTQKTGEIFLCSPDGSNLRKLPFPDDLRGVGWNWTPDSRAIIGHGGNPEAGVSRVFRVDVLTAETQYLVPEGVFGAVSPDGRLLAYVVRGDQGIVRINIRDLQSGEERMLVDAPEPGMAVYKPLFTPDGKEIAYVRWAGYGHEIWMIGVDGSNQRQVELGPLRPAGQYAFTPDGKQILIGAELYGVSSVWKIDLESSRRFPLTEGGITNQHVNLGPDGKSFCFARLDFASRLAYLDLASRELRYATSMDLAMRQPMVASDGTRLYFQALVNGVWQIWKAPVDGASSARAVISQDSISFFSPVPGQEGILHLRGVVPNSNVFGQIKWKQSLWETSEDGGRSRRWPSAGDQISRLAVGGERAGRILYSESSGTGEIFFVAERDGQTREFARDDPSQTIALFDWGRDERHVVMLVVRKLENGWRPQLEELDLDSDERTVLVEHEDPAPGEETTSLRGCRGMATSPDGTRVAVLQRDSASKLTRILTYEFATDTLEEVTTIDGDFEGDQLAWAPDGSGLAITLSRSSEDIYIWEPQRSADMAAAP